MPSVADVWLDLRTDDKKLGDDIERGARSAKVDRAGRSAGQRFSRGFKSGLGDAGGPLSELSHTLTGFGDATTVASRKANIFKRVVAGVALATGPLESSVSAAVGVTGALAAGLTAAGVGLGAYGAALIPVFTGLKQLTKLQAQAQAGSKTAQKQFREELKTLPPQIHDLFKAVSDADTAYRKWGMHLAGTTTKPLLIGLKAVNPLLKEMTPFVQEASGALTQLATEAVRGLTGSGFKEWLQTMLPLVRPVLLGIGHAIGNIIAGFGGITTAFAPFVMKVIGGLERLTSRFREWASDLGSHTGFQAMISQWQDMWPRVQQALGQVLVILKNVVSAWASMTTGGNSKFLWDVANPILAIGRMLSGNPALVQMLTYLYLIGKGAGQIKGVFGALQSAWGLITGRGGAVVGMEAAGGTMMQASRNMLAAAGMMEAASKGGAGGALGGAAGGVARGGLAGTLGALAVGPTGVAIGILGGLAIAYMVNHSSAVQAMLAQVEARNRANRITPAREAAGRQVFGQAGGVDTSAWKKYDAAASTAAQHVQSAWARARGEVEKFNSSKLGGMFTATARTAEAARRAVGTFTTAVADMGTKDARTVQARQTLINDLERTGVKSGTAERDVNKLATAITRHGEYSDQARAARQRLNHDIEQAFKDSQQGRADMERLTTAIKDHGVKSDAARGARKQLIQDLIDSGVDADTARGDVRRMIGAIADIKGKHVDITVSGLGQFTVAQVKSLSRPGGKLAGPLGRAAGGFIPGFGGGDRHPALLESGEAVVSKETTRAHASELRSWGVPGMQGGGVVPRFNDGPAALGTWTARNVDATMAMVTRATGQALQAGVRSAMRAAWKELFAGGAGIVNFMRKFVGQVPYVWGGDTPSGWDCSGLVSYAYRHAGIMSGRMTAAGFQNWGRPASNQPGAMVLFGRPAYHIGLSTGEGGRMIAAASPALGTIIDSIGGNSGILVPPNGFGRWTGGAGPTSAINLGREMAARFGWGTGSEWMSLYSLWQGESGWNPNARNPLSGAAGIPQDITGNMHGGAAGQILWGLQYIRGKYGDPNRAYSMWLSRSPHWYGDGLSARFNRPTVIGVGERGPEDVLAVPAGGSGGFRGFGKGKADPMGRVETLLSRLIGAVERQPAQTGAAVSDALDSASRTASYRAAYSMSG